MARQTERLIRDPPRVQREAQGKAQDWAIIALTVGRSADGNINTVLNDQEQPHLRADLPELGCGFEKSFRREICVLKENGVHETLTVEEIG
jgi:hypothetical protein